MPASCLASSASPEGACRPLSVAMDSEGVSTFTLTPAGRFGCRAAVCDPPQIAAFDKLPCPCLMSADRWIHCNPGTRIRSPEPLLSRRPTSSDFPKRSHGKRQALKINTRVYYKCWLFQSRRAVSATDIVNSLAPAEALSASYGPSS